MTRVKRGTVTHKRHKRTMKMAKGFWGQRKNIFKRARETLLRAMAFAFEGRKNKKRSMRALFIGRISAAVKAQGLSYSTFMHKMKTSNVHLNRKMLSQLAIYDQDAFSRVVEVAKR